MQMLFGQLLIFLSQNWFLLISLVFVSVLAYTEIDIKSMYIINDKEIFIKKEGYGIHKIKKQRMLPEQKIKSNVLVIISYIFLVWLWQFTLSFQSSMYSLMNIAVFVMLGFGTIGVIFCREERRYIKHTKFQVISYCSYFCI